MKNLRAAVLLHSVANLLLCGECIGDEVPLGENPSLRLEAIDSAVLDSVRGGFDAGDGSQISIGLVREILIDGKIVWRTSIQVAGAAQSLAGPMGAPSVGTVVQNLSNNQTIRTLITIDATVKCFSALQSMMMTDEASRQIARSIH